MSYVSVSGIVKQYDYTYKKYLYSERNKKPKCETCGYRMNKIVSGNNGVFHLGYFCNHCKKIYIKKKYEVFLC